jgi:hypothetical protein
MVVHSIMKKKQQTGILKGFETKYVTIDLSSGTFAYAKEGNKKKREIHFKVRNNTDLKDVDEVFVLYVGADPQCPKEFPFSFSFKSRGREFTFCLRTKEERDNYVEYFEMLEKLKNAYAGGP